MKNHLDVGVSLAFQDGVSTGMVRAHQDILAGSRASPDGGLSVRRLQGVGVDALSVAGMAHVAAGPAAPTDISRALPDGAASANPSGQALLADVSELSAPSWAASFMAAAGLTPMEQGASAAAAENALPAREQNRGVFGGVSEAVRDMRLDRLPGTALPSAAGAEQHSALYPRASDAVGARSRYTVRGAGTGGGSLEAPPWPVPDMADHTLLEQPLDRFAGRGGEARQDGGATGVFSNKSGRSLSRNPDRMGAGAISPMPWAPLPLSAQSSAYADPMDRTRAISDAADAGVGGHEETQKAQGPTEGDVFLDGVLVGRWMSRLLSREAGRASAGPTSYDPRRNAVLPGATVGG